jgi:penicillin-binding protein 2
MIYEVNRFMADHVVNTYLNTPDNDWYKARLSGLVFAVMAAFFLLLVRLFYLQVIEGEEFRRLSESNCIRIQNIDPPRGLIFDCKGELIVDNRPSFDVCITPKDAKPIEETFMRLAALTHAPVAEMEERFNKQKGMPSYNPVVVLPDVDRNTLGAIEVRRFDLPGVTVQVRPLRHYVHNGSAAHLLGYLGEISQKEMDSGNYPGSLRGDYIGKNGIERKFEMSLRGVRGGRQVEVDARGRLVRVLRTVPEKPGNNMYLTIDQQLQTATEALFAENVGAAVAIDPNTGYVLALVSSPTFDQNVFVAGLTHDTWKALIGNPERPMENKALQGTYPPASTYKILTAMAGLEEGVIDEHTTVLCPGYYRFGNRSYKCWRPQGHGSVDIFKALAQSCDVYFYQVGQRLGVDKLSFYARASGLGAKTGIDLDNEASGIIPTADWKKRRTGDVWQRGETLSLAIGQGFNLVTPLQMADFISSVANGGKRYRPLLVKKIVDQKERMVKEGNPELVGNLPIKPRNLDIVKQGLWQVVNSGGGTASAIRMKTVEIAGKTGTAQVISRSRGDDETAAGPAHLKPHAWFVAYAPAESPKIAVAVIVEHGEHGSSAAAPIARDIIKYYLREAKKDDDR